MSSLNSFAGRMAQLHGIVSKPELNGLYVLIRTYLPERDRFNVTTLPVPTADSNAVNMSVKFSSLRFCSQDKFHDKYKNPTTVQVVSFEEAVSEYPSGTILNLCATKYTERPTVLTKSHRIVGTKVCLNSSEVPEPQTMLLGCITVTLDEEDAVLEFEDIQFIGIADVGGLLTCTKGRSIIFRRCSFHELLIVVGSDAESLDAVSVVFENCLFDTGSPGGPGGDSTGLAIANGGTVTLLNCVFRKYWGAGVSVNGEGKVSMIHCRIGWCLNGVGTKANKTGSVSIVNCIFAEIFQCGILLDEAGPTDIRGCKVERCSGYGIYANGRSSYTTNVTISKCDISGCCVGVGLRVGKFDAHISSTSVRNNTQYGLWLFPGILGRVAAQQCAVAGNKLKDLYNTSCAECRFTVDGALQEAILVEPEEPSHLFARRCYQQAGICDINCANCGRKEEPGEKFKKCGKCENVCYCSRECQKAHWKEHKKDCMPIDVCTSVKYPSHLGWYAQDRK